MNTNEHENFRRCRQKRLPEPLNRSRRRESALILCRESNQVRRLTSAATRFMESPLSFFACIGTMNQIGTPLPALSPPGGERVAEGRERSGSWRGLHDSRLAPRDHERWGETPSSPDLQLDRNRALDGVSPHRVNEEGQPERLLSLFNPWSNGLRRRLQARLVGHVEQLRVLVDAFHKT